MIKTSKRQLGTEAEQQAIVYLEQQGLLTIERNFYSYCGEIDVIMQDQDYVVFVEVRKRSCSNYGDAVASVGFQKQQKIIKTAEYFLMKQTKYVKMPCRFDIVAISPGADTPIEWLKNAFQASY